LQRRGGDRKKLDILEGAKDKTMELYNDLSAIFGGPSEEKKEKHLKRGSKN